MSYSLHWLAMHTLQSTLALVGAAVSAVSLMDARRDLHAVRARRLNGLRLTLARWHVRNEWVRLGVQIMLAWVGVAATITAQVPFGVHDTIITLIIVYATVANRVDRSMLLDIDEKQQEKR